MQEGTLLYLLPYLTISQLRGSLAASDVTYLGPLVRMFNTNMILLKCLIDSVTKS